MVIDFNFNQLEKELQERGRIDHLENGVTIISENIPGFGLALGEIEMTAGSYHDEPEDAGAMHFLEHMVFNGSKKYRNQQKRNQRAGCLGLKLNATTGLFEMSFPIKGENKTTYLLQENFPQAFDIIADQVFFPLINPLSIEKERKIIQREQANNQQERGNNPYSHISDVIKERVYGNNTFLVKNEGLGSVESIERIVAETLKKYHNRFFVGENTIVALGGDINKETNMYKLVRNKLHKIPQGTRAPLAIVTPEEPYKGTEIMRFVSPVLKLAPVEIYFQTPGRDYKDFFAVQMMSTILGGFPYGLISQKLREERGLVYSSSCAQEGHEKTGFVKIAYSVAPHKIKESLYAIDATLNTLKKGEFHADTVDAVKARSLPDILNTFKNPGWVYNELCYRHTLQRAGFEGANGFDNIHRMMTVTKDDIVRVANTYLTENRLVVLVASEFNLLPLSF